ncbi:hypothetical protein ACJ5NV_02155 [Loktanella agnita]|uniref:hypothetical protein n=1 Tax=Loktanella agnita TaxID=287097 RepID=UPI00398825D8
MKSFTLALALSALATQSAALSCMRPDPVETFNRVAAAPDDYYVLYGQLTFDTDALPEAVSQIPVAEPDPIDAFFRGKGLTRQGFTSDYISPAALQVTCAGSWCGSARSGVDALYFVRADGAPVTMEAGACGGMIFEQPDQATLNMMVSCMQGGECSPQPLQ